MFRRTRLGAVAAGVVAVAAAFSLAACGSSNGGSSTSSSGGGGTKYKIAFVMGAESDPFFQAMKVGAEAQAAESNVDLIWQGDPKEYSPATQIPYVDQVLAQNINALVLIPTDPKALQPSVEKAVAQGVTVLNVDTRVENLDQVLTFITGNNEDGGAKAADAIATAIGYKDGQTYQVAVGLTSETATTNVARLDGFKKTISEKYKGIEIVDVAYSQSKPEVANTNVNNWLTKYPNLAGIFAIDGTNAQGAAAAIQAKGLVGKVALVGYDAYPDNVKLIKDGVFTALIAQDPALEARTAIKNAVQFLNTKSKDGIEHEQTIPNVVLDKNTSEADLQKYTYVAN